MSEQDTQAKRRRREHSAALKRELIERSLQPGASVSGIALDSGINANLLFKWRREHLRANPTATACATATSAPVLLPVTIESRARGYLVADSTAASATRDHRQHRDRHRHSARQAARHCRRDQRAHRAASAARPRMIGLPSNTRVWIVAGHTDMRKGFDGLAAVVQTALAENPFCGHVFVFRGRRGDILKVLWFDGQGLMLLAKRLERGRFIWPQATSGSVSLTPAQLSMLLEGIDWRMPMRTHRPELAA